MAKTDKDAEIIVGGHKRPSFLIAVPTLGMTPIEFTMSFTRLQMPVNCVSHSMVVSKMEVGKARELVCHRAIEMQPQPEYIFFHGDDHIAPWDAAINLYAEMETGKWDVLSGLYYMKQDDVPMPIAWKREVVGPLIPYKHYQPGEVVSVDVVPMDFCFIRTEFLKQLTTPFFKTGPTMFKNSLISHTEDVWFCEKVKAAGGKIGCHMGVRIGHIYAKTGEVF